MSTEYQLSNTTLTFSPQSYLKQVMAGTVTACIIAGSINGASFSIPQSVNSRESVISTPFQASYSYNSGNINLYIEGVAAVRPEGLNSLRVLDEIADLKDDWNNNGASKFSESIIATMRKIIGYLEIQPMIFPTAKGSIQFEYENDANDYLEFELFENLSIKKFTLNHNGLSKTEMISLEKIDEVVKEFYGRNN